MDIKIRYHIVNIKYFSPNVYKSFETINHCLLHRTIWILKMFQTRNSITLCNNTYNSLNNILSKAFALDI